MKWEGVGRNPGPPRPAPSPRPAPDARGSSRATPCPRQLREGGHRHEEASGPPVGRDGGPGPPVARRRPVRVPAQRRPCLAASGLLGPAPARRRRPARVARHGAREAKGEARAAREVAGLPPRRARPRGRRDGQARPRRVTRPAPLLLAVGRGPAGGGASGAVRHRRRARSLGPACWPARPRCRASTRRTRPPPEPGPCRRCVHVFPSPLNSVSMLITQENRRVGVRVRNGFIGITNHETGPK